MKKLKKVTKDGKSTGLKRHETPIKTVRKLAIFDL